MLSGLKRYIFRIQIQQFTTFHGCNINQMKTKAMYGWSILKYSNRTNSPGYSTHRLLFTESKKEDELDFPEIMWIYRSVRFRTINLVQNLVKYHALSDIPRICWDFLHGANQAIRVTCRALSTRDYEALDGLVRERTMKLLKQRVDRLSSDHLFMIAQAARGIVVPFPVRVRWKKLIEDNGMILEVSVVGTHTGDLYGLYVFQKKYINDSGEHWILSQVNYTYGKKVSSFLR